VLLLPDQLVDLRQAGYRLVIDEAKTARLTQPAVVAATQTAGIPGFACYRTVEETYTDLAGLAAAYPALANWIDMGDSWEKTQPGGEGGYDIYALRLTNQAKPGPKPKFFLLAAIHAREYTTAELATRFAEQLLAQYNIDPDVTWLLDYTEIHIIAQANPDGRKRAEVGSSWRKNTDNDDGCSAASSWGTDLNRNSSFKWNMGGSSTNACNLTYHGSAMVSEPETQAIEAYAASIFADQRGPSDTDIVSATVPGLFISLHSYGQLVLYPWGWTTTPAPNATQLTTLGRKFGYHTGYAVCNPPVCLYNTSGTTDDFTYGALGVASYTFELGNIFFESCNSFTTTILTENLAALRYAAKAARLPYQTPAGPESLAVTVDASLVISGTSFVLRATADDTRYASNGWGNEPTQVISATRYSIDTPAWITGTQVYSMTAADGLFDAGSEAVQATVDTTGWAPGRHLLLVESQDSGGQWGVPGAVFVDVAEATVGVALSHIAQPGTVGAGSVITYTLFVTNTGLVSDTFGVTTSVSIWPTSAPPTIGPLAALATAPLIINVNVPPTATVGLTDTLTVTVTSQTDPTQQSTRRLTTQVIEYRLNFPWVLRNE
ncbi:MAG: peptidase M14, partial [Chloroflexota bacterium]|nr:peptidase M14 [Chloroflexota bacterium]